ncbi:MAG: cation diffusion facilitator family transporter [Mucilaginibacter sp.]
MITLKQSYKELGYIFDMPAPRQIKPRVFLYISLATDVSIASAKFIAAAFTGSASMISEGIHSVIDAISQVMLIWGVKVSKRKADIDHPFGYGRELYFWSFIVSLVIFILGGCISVWQGFNRLHQPFFAGNPNWNYAILLIAFIFNLISMLSALKVFNEQRGKISFWKALIHTKDPSTIIVLLGDIGDLIGLTIAFFGIYIGRLMHDAYYDGIASMVIGIILIVISGFLIRESKSLLMGETIHPKRVKKIIALVEWDENVVKVKKHFSIYRSPEDIFLQLNTVFKDDLTTHQITDTIERITKNVKSEYPLIKQLFIEPVAK